MLHRLLRSGSVSSARPRRTIDDRMNNSLSRGLTRAREVMLTASRTLRLQELVGYGAGVGHRPGARRVRENEAGRWPAPTWKARWCRRHGNRPPPRAGPSGPGCRSRRRGRPAASSVDGEGGRGWRRGEVPVRSWPARFGATRPRMVQINTEISRPSALPLPPGPPAATVPPKCSWCRGVLGRRWPGRCRAGGPVGRARHAPRSGSDRG